MLCRLVGTCKYEVLYSTYTNNYIIFDLQLANRAQTFCYVADKYIYIYSPDSVALAAFQEYVGVGGWPDLSYRSRRSVELLVVIFMLRDTYLGRYPWRLHVSIQWVSCCCMRMHGERELCICDSRR